MTSSKRPIISISKAFLKRCLTPAMLIILILINKSMRGTTSPRKSPYMLHQEEDNKPKNVHFLSFADGRFKPALQRIHQQATNFEIFKSINLYDIESMKKEYPDFCNQHAQFITSNQRGIGYWIWKPYLILKKLEKIKDNDILLYIDAGCELDARGMPMFNEFLAMVEKNDILTFQLCEEQEKTWSAWFTKTHSKIPSKLHFNLLEKTWTKSDLIEHMKLSDRHDILNSRQIIATALLLKKTSINMDFVKEWVSIASNYHLLNDEPSIAPNDPNFIEHRHDQSIFSLLIKRDQRFFTDNPQYVPDDINVNKGKQKPILALRNYSSKSLLQ